MDQNLWWLTATKIGFLVAVIPIFALLTFGEVSGIGAKLLVLSAYSGAAVWGYGYGKLSELD